MLCPDWPAMPKAVITSVDDENVRRSFCSVFGDGDEVLSDEVLSDEVLSDEHEDDDAVVRVLCEIRRAYGPLFPVTNYESIVVKRDTEFTRCFQRYDSDSRCRTAESVTSGDAPTNPSKNHGVASMHPPSKPSRDIIVTSRNQAPSVITDWSTTKSFESDSCERDCADAFRSNSTTEIVEKPTSSDARHVTPVADRAVRGGAGHCCSIPPFLRPIEEEDIVFIAADDVTTCHGNQDEVTSDDDDECFVNGLSANNVESSNRNNDVPCLTGTPCFSTGSSTKAHMTSSIASTNPVNANHSVTSDFKNVTSNDVTVTARRNVLRELSSTGKSDEVPQEVSYRKTEQRRGQFEFDQTLVLLMSVVTFVACLGSVSPSHLVPLVAVMSLFFFLFSYFEMFCASSATDRKRPVFTTDHVTS